MGIRGQIITFKTGSNTLKSNLKPKFDTAKFNWNPAFLIVGIGACVALSAFVSYKLGDAALEGVVQPVTNPIHQSAKSAKEGEKDTPSTKFTPVNIEKVSKDTRAYIKKQQKTSPKETANSSDGDAEKDGDQAKAGTDTEKKP